MFKKSIKLAASLIAVTVALASVGMFNQASAAERKVKAGDSVDAEDGDTIIVDASDAVTPDKAKVAGDNKGGIKTAVAAHAKAEPAAPTPKIMADDFSAAPKADDEVDQDSVVELAVRGNLAPTGPAIGGTLGFSYRPANRVRLYSGFNAGKGLVDLKGEEKELLQFGFTAGVSRVVTRTVEAGLFGTMSWSYRELTKSTSTSFIGVGPGFRLNKLGGMVFFEAGIPIGFSKKFADGSWEWSMMLQTSFGFHF
jgi:hypothetical protein